MTTRCWRASPPCCARPRTPTTPTKPRRSWRPRSGWPPPRRSTSRWHARTPRPAPRRRRRCSAPSPSARRARKGLRTYVQLFVVIAAANDVKCDVASNSTFVYAYGFAEDIDATHALYASLVVQMVKASDAYIATGAAPADADDHGAAELPAGVRRPGRPAAGRGPRGGQGRGHRATAPTVRARRLRCATRTSSSSRFYRQASKARGTWRATSATAGYSSAARRAGDRAGRRARLGPSTELAGSPRRSGRADGTPCPVTPNAQRSMPQSNSCGPCSTAPPQHGNRLHRVLRGQRSRFRRRRGSPRSSPCSATSTTCSAIPPCATGGPAPSR